MQKKLTISMDQDVYEGLQKVVGKRNISRFLTDLARPYVLPAMLEDAYRAMASDREREAEAMEWSEGLIGDVG